MKDKIVLVLRYFPEDADQQAPVGGSWMLHTRHGERGDPQGADADPLAGHEQRSADPTEAVPPAQRARPQRDPDGPQAMAPGGKNRLKGCG